MYPKIGLFYKIASVILIFTVLTYFLTTRFENEKYNEQDLIVEYQSLILYQMMAEQWHKDSLDQKLIADLDRLKLSAFIGLYEDSNANRTLDFDGFDDLNQNYIQDENEKNMPGDKFLKLWTHKQNSDEFNPHSPSYTGVGDKDFIAMSLDFLPTMETPYASYGFYGQGAMPAVFLEFPIENNKIMAYWLILDYQLPKDRDWTLIILPVTVLMILGLVFWVISAFLYPVKLMIAHVRNLKRGSLNQEIQITTSDELGELMLAINKMTQDINILINQKDDLLLDVSHELKTPLTRLKFILANMKDISEENKLALNKEINSLKDMISNMLLSDKLSTPYIEDLNKEQALVSEIISDTCDMFYKIKEKMKIKLLIENQTIFVDKYRFCLALKNLIDNALKYSENNKEINLIVSDNNENVLFTVKDFGKGIHKEQIKEIIKPLYRGRQAKEKSRGGFGLGLAIAKKIIEAHNGNLKIDSKLNEGSEFTLIIPKG